MLKKSSFLSRVFLLILLCFCFTNCNEQPKKSTESTPNTPLISYVDPFIGTEGNGSHHTEGNVHPGAVRPWGMVALSPQSFDFTKMQLATGYRNDQDKIYGFSCVNFSGVGCPAGGSVPFKFFTKPFETDYPGSKYSNQIASPGFYSVTLDDENISVNATATTRTVLMQVNLPAGKGNIYLDLMAQQGHVKGGVVQAYTSSSVKGYQLEGYFCGTKNRSNVYFTAELDKKADSTYLTYTNKTDPKFEQHLEKEPSGIVYVYNNEKPTTVQIKVGVSYVSTDNAQLNLDTEQKGFQFDKIKKDAETEWEDELSKITIETPVLDDKIVFYTSLYHSLLMPLTNSDTNGEFIKMGSTEVGKTNHTRYSAFSLWDTYRTTHPLFTLAYPERQLEMIQTMLDMYDEAGWLPKWPVFNFEPHLMTGDPSPIVIGDAYVKGIRGFDINKAYEAFEKHSNQAEGNLMRRGLKEYNNLGYIAMDGEFADVTKFEWDNGIVWGTVSTSMEFSLSDFNIAQVAKALGKDNDYEKYLKKSMSFMNYYNDDIALFQPKNKDGSWYEPFDPTEEFWDDMRFGLRGGPGFCEGSAWQYIFSIPHGMKTVKEKMGDERFLTQLNTLFDKNYFDMTNEPGLGFPFFYNYTDLRDHKTAETVHRLLKKHFTTKPNGYPGNDDAGAMSAWVVFSMMGIYPDTPGKPEYLVTTPVVEKATIQLNSKFYKGKELVIERDGPVDGKITDMTLNNYPLNYEVNHNKMTEKGGLLKIKTVK
ncbi:GH92 family glycosyl hydrolase [Tamlana sp. I1]|uniref:GH92 family glycosyl hydrolase n=1 Tax=Tamlana sp. I1 TaxID=2762061 RepID=UPI001890AD07|nr:GH92 family glycosyl hydrolase [Tamlana sp. I1]